MNRKTPEISATALSRQRLTQPVAAPQRKTRVHALVRRGGAGTRLRGDGEAPRPRDDGYRAGATARARAHVGDVKGTAGTPVVSPPLTPLTGVQGRPP